MSFLSALVNNSAKSFGTGAVLGATVYLVSRGANAKDS